jgi:cyclopropane-fatty-acyl-phospholipid synthase
MNPARIARELFDSPSRAFPVRLWDGTVLSAARDERVRGTLVLRDRGGLEALLPPVSEQRLAEAILDGLLDLEGDAIALIV